MRLEDKVVIIAGAGPGIGEGVVHCLAEEGADVAVIDIDEVQAKRIANDVKKLGRRAVSIGADLTDKKQCKKAVQTTLDTLGKIDSLVNIVGGLGKVYLSKDSYEFVDQTEEEWEETFKLNLMTVVFMCQAVAPHFIKQKHGMIVNTASIAGQIAAPISMSYSVSKAAVIHFTINLARALAPHNINVNALCPGVVYTPGFHEKFWAQRIRLDPEQFKGMTPKEALDKLTIPLIPLGRLQTVEDMGRAVVYLVSDDAKNVTGQQMTVDGGVTS